MQFQPLYHHAPSPCVSVFHLPIYLLLSVYILVLCPFLEVPLEAFPLPLP